MTKFWWKDGKVYSFEYGSTHFEYLQDNLELFGLTEEIVQAYLDRFGEEDYFDELYADTIGNGWIRVLEGYQGDWFIQGEKLTKDFKDCVWYVYTNYRGGVETQITIDLIDDYANSGDYKMESKSYEDYKDLTKILNSVSYKLTDNEILSTLILNNKDRFIKSIDWENADLPYYDSDGNLVEGAIKTRRLEDVLEFFHSHANLENKIDWNEKDKLKLAIAIDELISETYKKADERDERKRTSQSVDWDSHDCKVWYNDENYTLVSPLSYESAVFMDSDSCGGAGAKWCIGYEESDKYWNRYRDNDESFVMIYNKHPTNIYHDLKVMVEISAFDWYKIWNQSDDTVGENLYGSTECLTYNGFKKAVPQFSEMISRYCLPKIMELKKQIVEEFDRLKFEKYRKFFEALARDGLEYSREEIEDLLEHSNPIGECLFDWMSESDILSQIIDSWIDIGLLVKVGPRIFISRETERSDIDTLNDLNIPLPFRGYIESMAKVSLSNLYNLFDGCSNSVVERAFIVGFDYDGYVPIGSLCDEEFTFNGYTIESHYKNSFVWNLRRFSFYFSPRDSYWDECNLYEVVPKLADTQWGELTSKHVDLDDYLEVARRGYVEPITIKLNGKFKGE